MNLNISVFLVGLFVVPIVLLSSGHKLRKLGPRQRRAFWGAVIGHCVAGTLAVTLGMIPPEAWTESETARGFVGLWAMFVLPVAGAIIASLMPGPRVGVRSAALLIFALTGLTAARYGARQQSSALVGLVGHWTSDSIAGSRAMVVNGEKWSGKTEVADLQRASQLHLPTLSDSFVKNATAPGAFALAIAGDLREFANGALSVKFNLVGGKSDQNAGIVFGLRPNGEYLYLRYNTKDGNLAIWRYANGERTVIAHGEGHKQLPLGAWHDLTVTIRRREISGSVPGHPELTVSHVLPAAPVGRTGVWAKRDAVTGFRGFSAVVAR